MTNSIGVYVKLANELLETEIDGASKLSDLYPIVSEKAGLMETTFSLTWEGERIDRQGTLLVSDSGLCEDSVIAVEKALEIICSVEDLAARKTELTIAVSQDPDAVLVIDTSSLKGCILTIPGGDLPPNLKKVVIAGSNVLEFTHLDDFFLSPHRSLMSVDLSGLSVNGVGSNFLSACSSLQTVDLSFIEPPCPPPLVGPMFLACCKALKRVDLSPLRGVSCVKSGFLKDCSQLEFVDLSPLHGVREVDHSFLAGCSSIQSVDLTALSSITELSHSFLSGATSLTSLDLSPFRDNIYVIGTSFLAGCTSLATVDLRPLSNVRFVAYGYLANCRPTVDTSPLDALPGMGSFTFDQPRDEPAAKRSCSIL
eukprot:TRINITY_DN5067_c1_g1_i1.p1 TRINITY_DN5067_c1_g1~~TRINITY_DN5067_c1_g1_i1.p1  ORF type:complete len:375 (+),score=43.41 TRINITY_DN5067_c1_g1_i1:23-1126(+)